MRGGGATEIIAQARAGLSQIATGSYVGTGTYGQSNPTVITCGFKAKQLILFNTYQSKANYPYYISINGGNYTSASTSQQTEKFTMISANAGSSNLFDTAMYVFPIIVYLDDSGTILSYSTASSISSGEPAIYVNTKFSVSNTSISYYCESHCFVGKTSGAEHPDERSAKAQYNVSGMTYCYIAIG